MMGSYMIDGFEPWFKRLSKFPELVNWVTTLRKEQPSWFTKGSRGDVTKWLNALEALPAVDNPEVSVNDGILCFTPHSQIPRKMLQTFHPWRKGPLSLGQTLITTEWRSDWKWERVSPHLDLSGKQILDIGCGNGYYLWRMLEAGADWALGIDPYIPYVMQFHLMQHFAGQNPQVGILPIGVERLPRCAPCFDTVFSMGVLYHQKSPIEHLIHGRELLKKGGEFILETIVLPPNDSDQTLNCLVPEGRYAKMKNVYFLPSVTMLCSWMRKVRFRNVSVLDLSQTTIDEQRQTEWMTFESLKDFLDPIDQNVTIEGHPAPWRVVIRGEV